MPFATGVKISNREKYDVMRSAFSVAVFLLFCNGLAQAHSQSSSRLTLDLVERVPRALTLLMTLPDLLHLIDLDNNGDGQLTWGEVSTSEPEIFDLIVANVSLRAGGSSCAFTTQQEALSLTTHADAPSLRVALQVNCPDAVEADILHFSYQLFFDDDPTHRALLSVSGDADADTYLLTTDTRALELRAARGVRSNPQARLARPSY